MPNRILKESVCTSETINSLSWFQEVFFYRLIVNCDDYGRFDARPAVLKARLFPLKERITLKDVESALTKLVDMDIVRLYECDSKPYLYLPTWSVHQTPRAKKSKYPAPVDSMKSSEIICKQMQADAPDIRYSIYDIRYSGDENDNGNDAPAREGDPAVAAVMNAYLDRINPTPSQTCVDELLGYVEQMGAECCLRAFDIALDAKKANWFYIKGILRKKLSQGVHCIADWDALEERREAERNGGDADSNGNPAGKWDIQQTVL